MTKASKSETLRWGSIAMRGCVLAVAALLAGCAAPPIQEQRPTPPSIRVAVLNFTVPPEWRDPLAPDKVMKERKGWWFGSRDVWHNPGMGVMAADIFAHELTKLPFIRMVPRNDVKVYLADKRDLMRRKLDERRLALESSANPRDREEALRIANMTEAGYDRAVELLPAREIGRELKVDRVLIGKVHDTYLAHNRTIHWYWSTVDIEVGLVDVDANKLVWYKRGQYTKNYASSSLVIEYATADLIEAMKREYFYQP